MADKKQQLASPHYIGGAVGLIIILLIGGYLMFTRQVSSPVVGGSDTEEETAQIPGNSSLVVADQAAGDSVAVTFMDLPNGGWIAIKEVSSNRVLGAARFPAGATSGEVPLLRSTTEGETYAAVVYEDDGDRQFDMKQDVLVEGVSVMFSAQ